MPAAVDHIFICTARGAPAAERLTAFGLIEGSANRHAGQGTACRRFFLHNAMLELLWVEDEGEARGESPRRLNLWQRFAEADSGACPFGVVLRPVTGAPPECPFASWDYRPAAMPELQLQIAEGTHLEEPMWCYFPTGKPQAEALHSMSQPMRHPAGLVELSGVHIVMPEIERAAVTLAMAQAGITTIERGAEHRLELSFDKQVRRAVTDFRPHLPLVFRY